MHILSEAFCADWRCIFVSGAHAEFSALIGGNGGIEEIVLVEIGTNDTFGGNFPLESAIFEELSRSNKMVSQRNGIEEEGCR